jgi:hypothetical protein
VKVLKIVLWSSTIVVKKEELKKRGFDLRRGTKRSTFVCEQEK